MVLTWLGHEAPFHNHVVAARPRLVARIAMTAHAGQRTATGPMPVIISLSLAPIFAVSDNPLRPFDLRPCSNDMSIET